MPRARASTAPAAASGIAAHASGLNSAPGHAAASATSDSRRASRSPVHAW